MIYRSPSTIFPAAASRLARPRDTWRRGGLLATGKDAGVRPALPSGTELPPRLRYGGNLLIFHLDEGLDGSCSAMGLAYGLLVRGEVETDEEQKIAR